MSTEPNTTSLPPQVQAAAARANELVAAQLAERTPESNPSPLPPPPPPPPAPAPARQPQAPIQQAPQNTPDWESRYNAMKGRFDQASDQNRQLLTRVTQMEHALATLQAQPAPVFSPADIKSITAQERSDYGDELIGIVSRVAREVAAAEVNPIRQQVGQVTSNLQMSEDEKFWRELSNSAPNYAELNRNQAFLDWLALPDRYSGVTRQELLTNARNRLDVQRVAAFFNDFQTEAAPRPRSGPIAETGAPKSPQVDLAAYAAPGRARQAAASPPPPQESAPTFTRAGIKRFYDDVSKGHFAGRDAEKSQIERDIMAAVARGHVT